MVLNLPENADSASQREVLDALPVLVFLERVGRVVYANAEARQTLGLGDEPWTSRQVEDLLWGLFPGTAEPQTLLTGTRHGSPFHATMPTRDGRLLPVEGTYSIVDHELRQAVIVAHPGGRESAPKSRLMDDLLASIPDAVAIVHGNHVIYTNAAFTRLFGYTAEEVSGGTLRDFIVPETRQHENSLMQKSVDRHGVATIETVRKNRNGDLLDVAVLAGPLVIHGEKAGYVLSYRDIGGRRQIEAKLQHDALHDALTGLPNRALFLDRLKLSFNRRARRRDQVCGVLFLDLDRFKEINDTLGHAAGDQLLVAVSERLCSALRPQDTAARLGGDEFAVLVENIFSVADLTIVANRILGEMARPFDLFGRLLNAGASIGAALSAPDHTVPEMLIRDADFAMYRAKQSGGSRFEIFDKNLKIRVNDRQQRERELRQILDNHEFEIWYQPIFRLLGGQLEGFESILHRRRSDGSVESLRPLLPVAEESGLSISLGRETFDSLCRQLCAWSQAQPWSTLSLTLNLSPRQFYHSDMVAQMKRTLAATGADPSRLLIEVDESVLSENPDAALVLLQRLIDCGLRVAVDNFGSALAPLNHLIRMPIDVLKLDPALTVAATSTGRQSAVLKSLVQLGSNLGVQVVAQGIQSMPQLEALRAMGCALGQGDFLSEAMDSSRAFALADQLTRSLSINA
jgi:diguanylate cyclase (GGDEF)-like protein/PAS domain S-box-containing protein